MTTGIMPLLDIIKDLGVDIFLGPDPVEGGANLQQVKERIGNTVCLWGGMNAPVTLGTGTPDHSSLYDRVFDSQDIFEAIYTALAIHSVLLPQVSPSLGMSSQKVKSGARISGLSKRQPG